jgi:hypothetical protein
MTNTICGHERDVLRLGIQVLALSDNATAYADQIERDQNASGRIKAATRALVDPAKLAEILAERGRQLGLDASASVDHRYIEITITQQTPYKVSRTWWEPIEARALALRLLELPEGATAEDAMKALGAK